MALGSSPVDAKIKSELISFGFILSGTYARVDDAIDAVARGVVDEVHASAVVIVPSHAGGTYPVTGLSAQGMKGKIRTYMAANALKSGKFSMPYEFADAVGDAVTSQIISSCTVAVPYDGSGTFQVIGLDSGALKSAICSNLTSKGFKLDGQFSKAQEFAQAIASSVAVNVNSLACITGSFVAGGTFPVL